MNRLLALLALLGLVAAPALAQDENMIRPISRAHLDAFARLLELDDEQRQVAEVLHEGYMQELQRENMEMREAAEEMQRLWESGDFTNFDGEAMRRAQEKMAEASVNHIKANLALQDQFFSDMKAMLRDDQIEAFPRVERMRRRQMLLNEVGNEFPWAAVDLVDTLESLELSAERPEDFDHEIIRYEIAVDRELTLIMGFMMEMVEKGPEMMTELQGDMEAAQEMMDRFFEWMRNIRSINKEHARRLGSMLSPEDRARWETETHRRAFPQVYGNNGAGEAIAVAAGFSDLGGDQPERIEAVRVQFEKEFASANEAWAAALDAEADEMDMQSMVMSFMGEDQSESAKAERARGELNKRFRERLEAILTPEQVERLPDPPMTRREQMEAQMREMQEQMERQMEEAEIDR